MSALDRCTDCGGELVGGSYENDAFPDEHLCQACVDNRVKAALQRLNDAGIVKATFHDEDRTVSLEQTPLTRLIARLYRSAGGDS